MGGRLKQFVITHGSDAVFSDPSIPSRSEDIYIYILLELVIHLHPIPIKLEYDEASYRLHACSEKCIYDQGPRKSYNHDQIPCCMVRELLFLRAAVCVSTCRDLRSDFVIGPGSRSKVVD